MKDFHVKVRLLPPAKSIDLNVSDPASDPPALGLTPASARRALEFLDRALVMAGVSVWRVDLKTQRIHFNAVGFQAQGRAQDPHGIDLEVQRATIHPEDLATIEEAANQALHSDHVVDALARYRNPDGSWRLLLTRRVAQRDEQGHAVGLSGVSLDLSELQLQREQAQTYRERSHLAAEALGAGYFSREGDDEPVQWDDQLLRLYGRSREAGPLTPQQWLQEWVHPQDRGWLAQRIQVANEQWEPMTELRFRIIDLRGQVRWMQSWTRRVVRQGKRMSYGMHLDVTDRQLADERALQLQQEKQSLERAGQERSEFMARMSHELRTPMNAVQGFLRLMVNDPQEAPLSERQRERLAHIDTASQHMMRMVDNLLQLARQTAPPEAPQTAPAPMPDLAPAALDTHAQANVAPTVLKVLKVLCVEDNPVNLQLVRELLALRPAVQLRTAEDGAQGIAAALADPPDLLLLDMHLPDMGGLQVLQQLRATPATAPCHIVALSADAMPGHISAALAAGFDDYWTKPIQFDSFFAHIDRLTVAMGRPGRRD